MRESAHRVEQCGQILGSDARLGRFAREVQLQQHREAATGFRGASIEFGRKARAVHRVQPLEAGDRFLRLVALQVADAVPVQQRGERGAEQRFDRRSFRRRFLHVVLADVAQTGLYCGGDALGRLLLGGADDPHHRRIAPSTARGGIDACAQRGETRRDRRRVAHARIPLSRSNASVSSIGRPITLDSLPSMRSTKRRPSPCAA